MSENKFENWNPKPDFEEEARLKKMSLVLRTVEFSGIGLFLTALVYYFGWVFALLFGFGLLLFAYGLAYGILVRVGATVVGGWNEAMSKKEDEE